MNMSAPPVAAVRSGWRPVVTAFVVRARDDRVLVVKRSGAVSTYPGMWGGISGGLEAGDASLIDRALREIEEEAGVLRSALNSPAAIGRPLAVCDGGRRFLVHPFKFVAADDDGPRVTLNWENSEYAWVTPAELAALPHVPLLPETLARISGRGILGSRAREHWSRIFDDRAHGAAELAGWVTEALEDVAANEPPPPASPSSALDYFRDYAWELARARPSMAPLATAAADVLDAALAALAAAGGRRQHDAAAVCAAVRSAARTVRSQQRARARQLQAELAKLPVLAGDSGGGGGGGASGSSSVSSRSVNSGSRSGGGRVLTLSYSSTLRDALAAAAPRLAHVIVCEGRPLCEGAALAAELARRGVRNVSIITDAQAALFVPHADAVLLGADAVSPNGMRNKVGSLMVALAAADAGVPVYAACDTSKIGIGSPVSSLVLAAATRQTHGGGGSGSGSGGGAAGAEYEEWGESDEEELGSDEVKDGWPAATRAAVAGARRAANTHINVHNFYFEDVPLRLISGGIVCERGVLGAADVEAAVAARRAQYVRAFGLATLEFPPPPPPPGQA